MGPPDEAEREAQMYHGLPRLLSLQTCNLLCSPTEQRGNLAEPHVPVRSEDCRPWAATAGRRPSRQCSEREGGLGGGLLGIFSSSAPPIKHNGGWGMEREGERGGG